MQQGTEAALLAADLAAILEQSNKAATISLATAIAQAVAQCLRSHDYRVQWTAGQTDSEVYLSLAARKAINPSQGDQQSDIQTP